MSANASRRQSAVHTVQIRNSIGPGTAMYVHCLPFRRSMNTPSEHTCKQSILHCRGESSFNTCDSLAKQQKELKNTAGNRLTLRREWNGRTAEPHRSTPRFLKNALRLPRLTFAQLCCAPQRTTIPSVAVRAAMVSRRTGHSK